VNHCAANEAFSRQAAQREPTVFEPLFARPIIAKENAFFIGSLIRNFQP
jgi:hypothetical protein